MERAIYSDTQKRLVTTVMLLKPLDLDGFIQAISRAEAVAPLIDPVLYRRGCRNLQAIRKVAETAKKLQELSDDLLTAVIETRIEEDASNPPPMYL